MEIVSVKQNTNDVDIKVKRNPGEGEIQGLVFVIFDGEETHVFEQKNVSLKEMEMKTFKVAYTGEIVRVSVYPLFPKGAGGEGGTIQGDVGDTYIPGGTEDGDTTCTPDCTNSLGEELMCGPSENGCGGGSACGTCAEGSCYLGLICCPAGYHSIDGETCIVDCNPITNCLGKQCGDDGCGGTCLPGCESFGPAFLCNASQLCEECTQVCGARECGEEPNGCGTCGECNLLYNDSYNCNTDTYLCEMCTPDCTDIECGISLNHCGFCGPNPDGSCLIPTDECIDGICVPPESVQNSGVIFSVWPIGVGKIFDSEDLNKTIADGYFNNYWVKFPGSAEIDCIRIEKFVVPNTDPALQEIYNRSYIRLLTYSSNIQPGDNYEIWETYQSCSNS